MKELEKKKNNEIAVFNKEEFVRRFNPMNMMKEFRHVETVKQAIEAEKNSISAFAKNISQDAVLAMIELHLIALNESLNVHQKLSEYQMKEISVEIISLFYYMTMTEIALVFRRAKRGFYGEIKFSIDISKIIQWFEQYKEERISFFMQRSIQDNKQAKSDKEVIDGKLHDFNRDIFNDIQLQVLSAFKKTLKKTEEFNEEDFQKYKEDYNSKRDDKEV